MNTNKHQNFTSQQLYIKRIIFTNDRKKFLKNLLALIGLIFVLFNISLSVKAAQIFIEPPTGEIKVGEQFQADVFLNTEGEKLNAVEGDLVFPDSLELKEIKDGDSIINLWIERPSSYLNSKSYILNPSSVSFSGITPGGYKGQKGLIFSAIFVAKKAGESNVSIEKARVLKNDGLGTEAKVAKKNLEFRIENLGEDPSLNPKSYILNPAEDIVPPESFKPEIAKDNNLYDGKYFLVFATQDKISGIDHYEIQEGFLGKFVIEESPYLLRNQKLNKKITIKAVDKAGNERVAIVYPPNWLPWYENYWIIGIIMVIMFAGYLRWRRKRGKDLEYRS